VNVLLLEEVSGVVSGNIVGQRSNSILEIDQIEEQVGEGGDFWVELTLGDQSISLS